MDRDTERKIMQTIALVMLRDPELVGSFDMATLKLQALRALETPAEPIPAPFLRAFAADA